MTQLDPNVQIRLIDATMSLLGSSDARLKNESHAKKYIQSFRYVYCALAMSVVKGETRVDGEPEDCFEKLPQSRVSRLSSAELDK